MPRSRLRLSSFNGLGVAPLPELADLAVIVQDEPWRRSCRGEGLDFLEDSPDGLRTGLELDLGYPESLAMDDQAMRGLLPLEVADRAGRIAPRAVAVPAAPSPPRRRGSGRSGSLPDLEGPSTRLRPSISIRTPSASIIAWRISGFPCLRTDVVILISRSHVPLALAC